MTDSNGNGNGIKISKAWISVLIYIIGLTVTAVWQFSALSVRVQFFEAYRDQFKEIMELKTKDRYTGADAKRDWANNDRRFVTIDQRLRIMEEKRK